MPRMTDICVIGGGASGIAAAIAANMENPDASICIVEKKDKIGRKLLATGNGRCNFTNASCENVSETLGFFNKLGIKEREGEQGRIYPYSGQAKDVLRVFEAYLISHNIKIITDFTAGDLSFPESGRIVVCGRGGEINAGKALLATGGKAGPQYGCSGDGYKMARAAGHTVTKTIPALSSVECRGDFSRVKGERAKARVTLLRKGEALCSETGELQFTDYGLSGICIFNLSRHIRLDGCGFDDYEISADLFYDMSEEELDRELDLRRENQDILPGNLLVSLMPASIAACFFGGDADAKALKNLRFTASNVKGWAFAQCTSGGIPQSEINMETMESKIASGLYFAGELVDYDGPCGGYNLNNAWETGIKAGRAMAADV